MTISKTSVTKKSDFIDSLFLIIKKIVPLPYTEKNIMKIEELIAIVEEEFEDEIEQGQLAAEVKFREVFDWNSINALRLIALVKTEYDVTINAEDIQQSETVQDLYQIIEARIA
ncbi:MAG: hypothetical protein CSA95_00365 [Bacteroidetes bacterium]|nr:MAG: hypothetical protein CSA95_00365 [Bacteroidota bacterium]